MTVDDDSDVLDDLMRAARKEAPPAQLGERVLGQLEYRARLALVGPRSRGIGRPLLALSGVLLAAAALLIARSRNSVSEPPIAAERVRASSAAVLPVTGPSAAISSAPALDPCREPVSALGRQPLIDDFEDGDDAIQPLEGRVGFWRWAREIDQPGTAPALIPVQRPEATRANRLAEHVKGGQLVDWGATVEFNFRPACYDASTYIGVTFQARGPGRLYVAPREVSVIPIAEGGSCDHDCYNPHVSKVDLDSAWHFYQVRWSDLRQRGIGKPGLDPRHLHSLAFLIRPEDTPYDLWLDDVRFLQP
jgi:hypothetical protein